MRGTGSGLIRKRNKYFADEAGSRQCPGVDRVELPLALISLSSNSEINHCFIQRSMLEGAQDMENSMRQTAEAVINAFNNLDVDTIVAYRSTDCLRHFLPASMGNKPQDNTTYARSLYQLRAIFHNFSLTVNDVLADKEARRMCLWLSARADTAAGEYVNEYCWLLDFDETGTKIIKTKEYSDTLMAKEFFPKLQAAMQAQQAARLAE